MSDGLPAGWIAALLGDVVTPRSTRADPADFPDEPYVGLEHVEPHTNRLLATVPAGTMASASAAFKAGDVLYGRMRPYLNKVVSPTFAGLASAEFIVMPAPLGIAKEFLLQRLSATDFVQFACAQYEGDRPRVKFDQLANFQLLLPPAAEQTRIVAKLEALLSDLDAGVAELKAAQNKLQQYRQSLLKAAVEGALTQAWREANPAPEETGADLLARILRERRARWETQQLTKFEAQGKAPPKGWQGKYAEPAAPDLAGLPELPTSWVWCSIDQLANVGTGVTPLRSNSAYFDGGAVPWVTSGALNAEVVTQATEMVTEQALRECRLEVYPEGSLLVAMYGEGKTRGKCAELGLAATINQAIAAIVLLPSALPCKAFVKTVLLDSYEAMRARASGGVQPNLNLQIVKSLAVPLPPLVEQTEITSALAEQLASMQELAESLAALQRQSTAQRQNLLRAAFAGQLVPQDPADEPAAELLARIRAERATAQPAAQGRRSSKVNA